MYNSFSSDLVNQCDIWNLEKADGYFLVMNYIWLVVPNKIEKINICFLLLPKTLLIYFYVSRDKLKTVYTIHKKSQHNVNFSFPDPSVGGYPR